MSKTFERSAYEELSDVKSVTFLLNIVQLLYRSGKKKDSIQITVKKINKNVRQTKSFCFLLDPNTWHAAHARSCPVLNNFNKIK
jgi:hypothetical protein